MEEADLPIFASSILQLLRDPESRRTYEQNAATLAAAGLAEGQQVTMRVVDTPKGREAISLSL